MYQNSFIYLNTGILATGDNYDINNPSFNISGVVVGPKGIDPKDGTVFDSTSTSFSAIFLNQRQSYKSGTTPFNGGTIVAAVGGLEGMIIVRNMCANATSRTNIIATDSLGVLVLNNAANTVYKSTAIISDDLASLDDGMIAAASVTGFNDKAKIKIVMNGEGTQIFTNRAGFSGGVTINKGTLLFNATNDRAGGKNNIAATYNDDGTIKTAASTKMYTHGDLEMNAGTFGFIQGTKGGSWSFNNIYWKSGTIQLNVYASGMDVLTLDKVDGVGGALEKGDTSISAMNFIFSGADNSDYLLNDSRKIISWSSYDSEIEYNAANILYLGQEYKAVFETKTDGLYVQYIAVPEPATLAFLLGAFSLAITIVRKRK